MEEQEVKGRKAAIEQEKSELASTSEREQARPMVKVAIDIEKANIFGLWIMVISGIIFLVPFFIIWGGKYNFRELFGAFSDWGITPLYRYDAEHRHSAFEHYPCHPRQYLPTNEGQTDRW